MRIQQTLSTVATLRHVASVFTRIIRGELPAHEFHRDDQSIGFLSINPISTGHALIVPLMEVDHWLDIPVDLVAHMMAVAQRVGRAQEQVFSVARVGLVIAGFEVPHCHIHLIPTDSMAGMDFANAATVVDHLALADQARQLRDVLAS